MKGTVSVKKECSVEGRETAGDLRQRWSELESGQIPFFPDRALSGMSGPW